MAGQKMRRRDLFGGSLNVSIPERCSDISELRQVPDHQEVFADPDTDQSVIVEIVERMDIADTDSARQHFAELSESNNAIHSSVMETGTKLTSQGYTVYYAVGTQTVAKFKDDISDANLVEVRIFIIRIPLHDADIIISVNSPIKIALEALVNTVRRQIRQPTPYWLMRSYPLSPSKI